MTLQQLHYIITISEAGSLSRAAEMLYVSQPSLSSAVKELERENGNNDILSQRQRRYAYG